MACGYDLEEHDYKGEWGFVQAMDDLKTLHSLDPETAHGFADKILCDFLLSLGYEDMVKEFDKIKRWYG
jgi:hypothetical protein